MQIVTKLLSLCPHTADIQSQDEYEVYPIHLAAYHGHVDVVRLLSPRKLPLCESVSVYRNSHMQNALHSLCDGLQHGHMGDICMQIATKSSSSSSSSVKVTAASADRGGGGGTTATLAVSSLLKDQPKQKFLLCQQMNLLLKLFNDLLTRPSQSDSPAFTATTVSDSIGATPPVVAASDMLASTSNHLLFGVYTLDEQILTPFELLLPPAHRVNVLAALSGTTSDDTATTATASASTSATTPHDTAVLAFSGRLIPLPSQSIPSEVIQDLPIHILSQLKDHAMILANTSITSSVFTQSTFISAFKKVVNNEHEIELFKMKIYEISRLLLSKESHVCTYIEKTNKYSDSHISYLIKHIAYTDIRKWLNWYFRKSVFIIVRYAENQVNDGNDLSLPAPLRILKQFYCHQFDLFRNIVMYL